MKATKTWWSSSLSLRSWPTDTKCDMMPPKWAPINVVWGMTERAVRVLKLISGMGVRWYGSQAAVSHPVVLSVMSIRGRSHAWGLKWAGAECCVQSIGFTASQMFCLPQIESTVCFFVSHAFLSLWESHTVNYVFWFCFSTELAVCLIWFFLSLNKYKLTILLLTLYFISLHNAQ